MIFLTPTLVSPRAYQRMIRLAVAALLGALLLGVLPTLSHQYQPLSLTRQAPVPVAPAPVDPTTQTLPPGLGPVLNATLAADSGEGYAIAALASPADGLRADNPAQRFAATFGTEGVRIAPADSATFSLRATAISTANSSVALVSAQPTSAGSRVEYRRGGLTEWYVNGPRGLEQGFTLAAPPAGAEQFAMSLAVTGDMPTQIDNGLVIGDLRYSGLTVTDAAGTTLPAHLDLADGTIRIAVDARGAQWPVTVDPTITSATISADDHAAQDLFGMSIATTTLNGTTYIVVGAPQKTVGGNAYQGEAYVFAGSAGTYNQRARLTATDGAANNEFGGSVAITPSADGTTVTIAVGACSTGFCANKAYIFTGSGTAFTQQAILATARSGTSNPSGFGKSIAVAITDTGKTTVAVGAPNSAYFIGAGQVGVGGVYLFEGSGSTYSYLTEIVDPASNDGAQIGASVAFVSNNGTNTLVAGAPGVQVGGAYQGGVYIYTGAGMTYTAELFTATDGASGDNFGVTVALTVAHGVNTVVVGAPGKAADANGAGGAAYVLIGSGSTYTTTRLHDTGDQPVSNSQFGSSVAIGYAGGNRLIAVGAPQQLVGQFVGAGVVVLFTQSGGTYTQSSLSEPPGGNTSGDAYGSSVALTAAVNGDTTVIGGAAFGTSAQGGVTNRGGTAVVSYFRTAPAVHSIKAEIGDNGLVSSSSTGTFDGAPFQLIAKTFDAQGVPTIPVGVTFTLNFAGAAHGVFDRNRPNLTTLQETTVSDGIPTADGETPYVPVFPSDTAGTFTVTASVDGTQLSTTFHLTIISAIPTPAISRLTGTETLAGLPGTSYIIIDGSGYMASGISQVWMKFDSTPAHDVQLPNSFVVYSNGGRLSAYLPQDQLDAHVGVIYIYVKNLPGPTGLDGGKSNEQMFTVKPVAAAPVGSHAAPIAASSLILTSTVPALIAADLTDGGGALLAAHLTGSGTGIIAAGGGNIIAAGGGNIIAQGGGNIIAQGGGNIVPPRSGGTAQTSGVGASPSAPSASPGNAPSSKAGSTPQRNTTSALPARNPYYGSSDTTGLFLSPPIASNDIIGTYTRSISIDGITAPVVYTITNLDPNDGHPATITALSRTSAAGGDNGFTLTVTGTGFVSGSVLSYGGVQLTTTFTDAAHVSAAIPTVLLQYTGTMDVLVINPDPNGGASLPVQFIVTQPMAVSLLDPGVVSPGSAQFVLTVKGQNFQNGSTVKWNGAALATTFVSATQLTATVPAALVTQAGTAQVAVVDPLGGTSSAATFQIAVVNALPPPQPTASPGGGPGPLPGSRQPAGPPMGNPNPLPPSR